MKVMILIKANEDSEAGVLPDEKLLTEMGKFNEELVNAGIMLAGEGLHPSSNGKRVKFSGTKRTVIDGPERKRLKTLCCRVKAPKIVRLLLDEPDHSLGIYGRGHQSAFSLWRFPGAHLTG